MTSLSLSRENRCRQPSSASGVEVAGYFVDSSALVKRYVQEVGTSWVRSLTHRGSANQVNLARITAVEVTSAVAAPPPGGNPYKLAGVFGSLPLSEAFRRAIYRCRAHARSAGQRHAIG